MGKRNGFTLIELLIVIGLLAALASVFFSHFTGTREEVAHDPIVQKELSDIQRAFHRMAVDCVLQRETHYLKIAQYGLAPLMANSLRTDGTDNTNWQFETWDNERGRGWRGPYLSSEGYRNIDSASIGQKSGSRTERIPVLTSPHSESETDRHYYRVLAVDRDGKILAPSDIDTADEVKRVEQFWVVCPETEVWGENIESIPESNRRRLLIGD
ncbi:MAG: type II secretion system protein [Planctomycetia bacterium]|nr:type II secretion system protein [Planctomycetia bacterium]